MVPRFLLYAIARTALPACDYPVSTPDGVRPGCSDKMKGMAMEWWGYSEEHGWVVLDRSLTRNAPGLLEDLMFFRCKDATTFLENRKHWNPPAYRFGPKYITELPQEASAAAAAEVASCQARWPEFQAQMQRELKEVADRIEAARLEEVKKAKEIAREAAKARRKAAAAAAVSTPEA